AASAPVAALSGTYLAGTTDGSGNLTTTSENDQVSITGLPTSLLVQQTGADTFGVTTQGTGPIGSLTFGMANGAPQYLTTSDNYFRLQETGTQQSITGQIKGLIDATIDATSGIKADT